LPHGVGAGTLGFTPAIEALSEWLVGPKGLELLGRPSQAQWLRSMVDRFRPQRIGLVVTLPNDHSWLTNRGEPITTEPSPGGLTRLIFLRKKRWFHGMDVFVK